MKFTTVKELKDILNKLPKSYDDFSVKSFQAIVKSSFNGSEDILTFDGFDDVTLKNLTVDIEKMTIKIN